MKKSTRNIPTVQAAYHYSCKPKGATGSVEMILNQPKIIALLSYCNPANGVDMDSRRLGFCQNFHAYEVRDLHAVNSSMGKLLDKLAADYKAKKPALMKIIDAYKSSLEEKTIERLHQDEQLSAFKDDDALPDDVAEAGEGAIPVPRKKKR